MPTNHATITIHGTAAPGGSKTGFAIPGGGVRMTPANKKTKPWMTNVAVQAASQWTGVPIDRGYYVVVDVTFFLPRPAGHHTSTGKRAKGWKRYHTTKPDVTKLWRSTEDALSGIVWADDSMVSEPSLHKRYADAHGPMAVIEIEWFDNSRDYDKEGE